MSHRIPREYVATPQMEAFPAFVSPPSSPTLGLARQPSHDTLLPLIYITDDEGSPSPSPSSPCFPDDVAAFPGPRVEPAFAPVHRPSSSFRGGLKALSKKVVKSTLRRDMPLLVAFAWCLVLFMSALLGVGFVDDAVLDHIEARGATHVSSKVFQETPLDPRASPFVGGSAGRLERGLVSSDPGATILASRAGPTDQAIRALRITHSGSPDLEQQTTLATEEEQYELEESPVDYQDSVSTLEEEIPVEETYKAVASWKDLLKEEDDIQGSDEADLAPPVSFNASGETHDA